MKKCFALLLVSTMISWTGHSQTMEELQSKKAEIETKKATLQKEVDTYQKYQAEIVAIDADIVKLKGWYNGFTGIVGFDFNRSNNWASSPNPNSSSSALNIGSTGFINRITDEFFWRNKGIITKSWSDVDLDEVDSQKDDDGLFDNGTVDILNLSSLYGRNLNKKIALSVLAELNTSIGNFIDPGTFDLGTGITWTPSGSLVVVLQPLNYHFAFSGIDGLKSSNSSGVKIRADYTHTFAKGIALSSTFTTFIPYSKRNPTVAEYAWISSLVIDIWNGFGLGFSFGLRNAEFEHPDTQTYYSLGISYHL